MLVLSSMTLPESDCITHPKAVFLSVPQAERAKPPLQQHFLSLSLSRNIQQKQDLLVFAWTEKKSNKI